MAALNRFSEKLLPGRWDDMREMNEPECKATAIVAVEIEDAVARAPAGMPSDEPEDVTIPTWAGIVPMRMEIGDPVPDPHAASGEAVSD